MDKKKRDKLIIKLRKQRYTLAYIGKQFNLTRQRVHQIVNAKTIEVVNT